MTLREILDICQEPTAERWHQLPAMNSVPMEWSSPMLVDAGSTDEPAVTAIHYTYLAVYEPDPSLSIGWGMEPEPEERQDGQPDWLPADWNSARCHVAQVMLGGTVIWRAQIASVDSGAGRSGYVPWPRMKLEGGRHVGWTASAWERDFARLLNRIAGHHVDFPSPSGEVHASIFITKDHPLDR